MEFKEKLKQLIKTEYPKLRDLSDKFDMNYTQLSQYVNGKKISMVFLTKIIKEFPKVDLNWLLKNDNILHEDAEPYKRALTDKEIIERIEELCVEFKDRKKEE